jgi:hypothetical protein
MVSTAYGHCLATTAQNAGCENRGLLPLLKVYILVNRPEPLN